MECQALAEQLTDFMEGLLDADTEAAALEHLASCPRCEHVLTSTRNVVELANEHGRPQLAGVDRDRLLTSILQTIDTDEPQPAGDNLES